MTNGSMEKIKKTSNRLVIECSCHSHALDVVNDVDMIKEYGEPSMFYISVWSQSPFVLTWKDRLGIIWDMIKGRTLDGGDVVLEEKDVVRLIKFLTNQLKENKKLIKNKVKSKK